MLPRILKSAMALSLAMPLVCAPLLPGVIPSGKAFAADQVTSSYLVDASTGTLLSSEAPEAPFAPGDSAKLMTAAVVFEALSRGEVTPETTLKISEHAWRDGGAPARGPTMFARLGSEVPVADLLRGLIIQNANDAAIALAEGLAGDETQFAGRMNALAKEIGMTRTRFANPAGFDAPEAVTTSRDLALLAGYILGRHADWYPLYGAEEFTWNGIYQRNRNPLIGEIRGLDGFTAGTSERSGYNGVGSALRGEGRFIGVVAGHSSAEARTKALARLFESVDKDFETVDLYAAGDTVAEARVFGGTASAVALKTVEPVRVLLPRGDRRAFRLRVVYKGPLKAPVREGHSIGELRLLHEGEVRFRAPLVTAGNVAQGSVSDRAMDAIRETLFGWWLDKG
ncbi:D-alanyl-D-alanine carboxypeptidase [Stappia taiwanensis]|uniref:serine-type D-Ala-D-Ala carboxypeptidase n=1 Tax=Stappia taiwanensis TaxID=992267 RepID=A0A838XX40_9HYPH|nr:D-alanyl-D-alanine carboxypeptidase family protein [Stappia taiwanensis]MBA4613128.1 D-alanyl-D-alanine carboxypeptidase [Stappia taiwanensis]GGE80271.1 D-alanyl-D-alanine carboxypeptidase [Stappia taiwanensis]